MLLLYWGSGILPPKTPLLEKIGSVFSSGRGDDFPSCHVCARSGRHRSSPDRILGGFHFCGGKNRRCTLTADPLAWADYGFWRRSDSRRTEEWHRASMRTGRSATCILSRSAPVRPYPRNLRAARRPKRAFSPPGGVMRSTQACEPKRPSEYGDFDFSSGTGFSGKGARPRARPLLIIRRGGACRRGARR